MPAEIVQLPLGPLQTNCYLLVCDKTGQAAVIDPAWSGQELATYVEEKGWSITHILLTHAHFDHVGGLAELERATDAPVYIHQDALPMLEQTAASGRAWQVEIEQPEVPGNLIKDGDIITVGNLSLQVLYTPGHAPGHVSFYLAQDAVLFDGDVLFKQGIGRTDFPGSDYETLMQSIDDKLLVLPDDTTVLSGHGSATTIGAERRTNPFLLQND